MKKQRRDGRNHWFVKTGVDSGVLEDDVKAFVKNGFAHDVRIGILIEADDGITDVPVP